MARVFQAVDTAGRTCALKVPLSLEERFLSKFKDEAHLSYVSGGSEKMVGIREIGDIDGVPYIVMDMIDGQNLSELADKFPGSRVPLKAALLIGIQVAEGLDHLHDLGIVLRDLKPANILIDKKGQLFIIDLGLARDEASL